MQKSGANFQLHNEKCNGYTRADSVVQFLILGQIELIISATVLLEYQPFRW